MLNDHSLIVSNMTWSYSRIATYLDCPYKFLLRYIYREPTVGNFFAEYGTFMHEIIAKFLSGKLERSELVSYYLVNFRNSVVEKAPNQTVFENYFNQGIDYLRNIDGVGDEILGIEKEVHFDIGDKEFIGFVDLVTRDKSGISIVDNKSRALKPRSTKSQPTKTDIELDKYLRQLYLYSVPTESEFNELPTSLVFNCFRNQQKIKEPFYKEKFEETKAWALETIEKIANETEWKPKLDWFRCRYLCDCRPSCEYFKMFGGDNR